MLIDRKVPRLVLTVSARAPLAADRKGHNINEVTLPGRPAR